MNETPYTILGVNKDASPSEIKKAYRKQSKKHHPDKGGNHDTFSKISNAMAIIGDPQKRKQFDETGKTEEDSFDKRFQQFIMEGLAHMDNKDNIEHLDLIEMFTDAAQETKNRILKTKRNVIKSIAKYEKAVKRIKRKDGNDERNIILHLMQSKLDRFKREKITCTTEIEFAEKVIAVLGEYDFEFEVEPISDPNDVIFPMHHNIIKTQTYKDLFNPIR